MIRAHHVHVRRTALLLLAALFACGDAPTASRTRPAAVTIVAGNGQVGKAGERLPEFLGVQVTNDAGEALERVRVDWTVVSGAGQLDDLNSTRDECGDPESTSTSTYSITTASGFASVSLTPRELGVIEVRASVPTDGTPAPNPADFTADVTHPVVRIGPTYDSCTDFWGEETIVAGPWFRAPGGGSRVTVPVGTTVEWIAALDSGQTATVTAASAPPGGALFDSGTMEPDDRFEFVPRVEGTWEYEDAISGSRGTLTAVSEG